jgi:two-component system phosphate regulon response regulator PhoB|uniref:Response regulator transcription factor n=1 Tax=Desulfobacca acetoxidans TaxID=60893 RepID=A0A7C5EL69_9BACT
MARETILVVEDEENIRELLRYNLEKEGYRVKVAASGEEALKLARVMPPDLILLDLMLPGLDGLEVCRVLKQDPVTRPLPIIMLTAKGEEADIVTGLELGADDYITKPFTLRVVLARLRAVLRRIQGPMPSYTDVLTHHEMVIHPGRHEVLVAGQAVDLTATEFRLLHLLARRPGWVFTRQQIIQEIHGDDYPVTERSVDVQVVSLRKKLGPAGKYLETVRGIGYRLRE